MCDHYACGRAGRYARSICIDGRHLGCKTVAVIRNREMAAKQGFLKYCSEWRSPMRSEPPEPTTMYTKTPLFHNTINMHNVITESLTISYLYNVSKMDALYPAPRSLVKEDNKGRNPCTLSTHQLPHTHTHVVEWRS